MTGRTRNTELRPSDVLDISPDDAIAVGVREGDQVRVVSAYGAAVLPVRVSADVARGQLFATFQSNTSFVNALTSSHRDRVVGTPEYKVTAVHIEPLPAADRT